MTRRSPDAVRTLALGALIAVSACSVDAQSTSRPHSSGDIAEFSAFVQPVLTAGCASLDCHGNDGRPLRLYALHGLRRAVSLRGAEPDDGELIANMAAIDGLEPDAASIDDHLLLLKPLATSAGGLHHVGGDLWTDERDPAYRCLHAWLRAGASDVDAQSACAEAAPP